MFTFKKEERLCNKKLIDELFHNGSSFLVYPFRISWAAVPDAQAYPAQVLFSVPKRRYKKASDRNHIKRRMREAYRLHKQTALYEQLIAANKNIIFSVGFIGKEIADFALCEKKMVKALGQLVAEVLK